MLAALGRAGRRTVAVDLPGFAAADRLAAEGSVLGQLDRFGAAVADYAGEQDAVIVAGNSLGGAVALRLARDRSGRAARIAGIVPIAPAGLEMPRGFGAVEPDPIVRTLLSLPTPVPEAVVRALVGRAYRLLVFGDQGRRAARARRGLHASPPHAAVVADYLSTARRMLPELEQGFGLEAIRCPVLLVWGERDRMVWPRGAQLVRRALPGARLELLDGVGHCPQLEAPERLVELLLEAPEVWPQAA